MKRPTHIRRFVLGFALGASGLSALAVGNLSLPFSFAPGQPIRSADVNANFDALRAALAQGPADGSVTAPKLAADAPTTGGQVLTWNGTGLAWQAPTGGAGGGGGTLTGVTAGSGLVGGGTSGTVSLGLADGGVSAGKLAASGTPAAGKLLGYDGANLAWQDPANAGLVQFMPAKEQLSVGDANGTAPMINLRGGSTCCSGPGGHTPAWFKVFQNGSFVATGNLGIGVSPMQGKGYRTSWDSYKGAFRSGYADNEWDDANVGFFSWAGGSNSKAIGLYALAFGDTNQAEATSSIAFGSGNQAKGAASFTAGAGNRVCDTYGVALGNKAISGGPILADGKCDPDTFNIRGLGAVAIGYNVTASQDHTTALGKFASNNGFTGTFVWSDGSATQSADTFKNTANNEFAARATGGFRLRTNLAGTTGCNLPAGSGVFNCTSDRDAKKDFRAVDTDEILAKVRALPVTTWRYKDEASGARHMGPTAQDFHAAFGLGADDRSIGMLDEAGVALAAVGGLARELDEKQARLDAQTKELRDLRAENDDLAARVAALEKAFARR